MSDYRCIAFLTSLFVVTHGLPNWRPPPYPTLEDCMLPNQTSGSLAGRLIVEPDSEEEIDPANPPPPLTVLWARPHCAVAGSETRMEVFLNSTNSGELGLSIEDCAADSVELIHLLNDSWTESWYLLYGGSYSICHRQNPMSDDWVFNARIHLLEPTPRHCSAVRNGQSTDGFVTCEFEDDAKFMFFDGFLNEATDKPAKCTFDCETCLADGGKCKCHGSPIGGTCNVCAEQCSIADLTDGTCVCVTETAAGVVEA